MKYLRRYLLAILAISVTICTLVIKCDRAGESATAQSAPPSQTVTIPSMPRPEYLQSVADSTSGTTVMRVSDRAAFGSNLQELRHVYSKNQPWNADESYLLLNFKYPAALLDARTYKFIRWVRQPSEICARVILTRLFANFASTIESILERGKVISVTTIAMLR
jgi:hypothetical protein